MWTHDLETAEISCANYINYINYGQLSRKLTASQLEWIRSCPLYRIKTLEGDHNGVIDVATDAVGNETFNAFQQGRQFRTWSVWIDNSNVESYLLTIVVLDASMNANGNCPVVMAWLNNSRMNGAIRSITRWHYTNNNRWAWWYMLEVT